MSNFYEAEHRYILVDLAGQKSTAEREFCRNSKRQERPVIRVVQDGRRATVDADFIYMATDLTEDGQKKIHRLMRDYHSDDWSVGARSANSALMKVDQAISLAKQIYSAVCRDQYRQTGREVHLP